MSDYLNQSFNLSDSELVSVFDELPLWSSYFGAALLDQIEYRKGIKALDIGCGTGFPLIEIAMRLGSSSQVYGIDPWAAALERVSQKLVQMGIHNVSLLCQPAESLPFRDNMFDLIVSNNGINNVQDPVKVLSECLRIMKNDARLIMTVNLPGTMKEFYDIFKKVLAEHQLPDCIAKTDLHISSKRKTVEEYKRLLTTRGFDITGMKEDCFFMRFADSPAFFNHYFIKLAFLDSWKKIPPAEKVRQVFLDTEKALNSLAEKRGQLDLTIPYVLFNCRK